MYLDKPIPMRPHAVARAPQTAGEIGEMERRFPPRATRPKPLPTAPDLAVPETHVLRGIPWVGKEGFTDQYARAREEFRDKYVRARAGRLSMGG